jgi:haloacetate dehalogenase
MRAAAGPTLRAMPSAHCASQPSSLLPGFFSHGLHTPAGVPLSVWQGGSGPPLLLLHGHPQTHAMWHRVVPTLAAHFTLVLPDLRGYGASARPVPAGATSDPATMSKRVMAAELCALMQTLGHPRFGILAHDRGARVAHRLALDHPEAVGRLMLLDIAPTLAMYEHTGDAFARAYWHWFFLIQPPPLPERLIEADPRAYLRDVMGRRHAGLAAFDPAAWCDYEAAIQRPGSAGAICDDYRASAGIDLEHDRESRRAGQRLTQPLAVRWGAHGAVARCFDVPALWHDAHGGPAHIDARAMPCGHYIAEELPEALAADVIDFFAPAGTHP